MLDLRSHFSIQISLALLTSVTSLCLYSISFPNPKTSPREKRRNLRDPPGPKGIPVIGHELQIPSDKQWLTFDAWAAEYGDVVRITIMGKPIIILSSARAALDLLETKGNIYSDRPRAVMAGELVGWDRGLGYAQYGERFKEFRRMFHQTMGPRAVSDLQPLQERENVNLLLRLLENPDDFIKHARQSTGAAILMLSYGYQVEGDDDYLVKIAEDAMIGFAKASEPGAFLVDRFPLLKLIPEWFPGGGFKRIAKQMREDLERLYNVPFGYVLSQMAAGSFIPSFTSRYLEEKSNPTQEQKEFVKAAAASLYSGGADTTPSSISAFILAMCLYPEVQSRGQAEIDRVIGDKRLPSIIDRHELPYVNTIVKEVLRWNPAVPLGLPHQLTTADVYRDFILPEGAIVWANIWTILHDPSVFPEPERFWPERYLTDDGVLLPLEREKDPSFLAFGFGRRICPGMQLADNSIFLTIATVLAGFNISKKVDKAGAVIEPEVHFSGFISHPKPFQCSIHPRSENAETLIRDATTNYSSVQGGTT